MISIKNIFIIGHGPSSSHTLGPAKACDVILEKYKNAKHIKVTLFGSLAKTGKGHLTDYIIDLKLKNIKHKIIFDFKTKKKHPNTIVFNIVNKDDSSSIETVYSIGGGSIKFNNGKEEEELKNIYPHKNLKSILQYCETKKFSLVEYVKNHEDKDIRDYLKTCLTTIQNCIENGLNKTGALPGLLKVERKAKHLNSIKNISLEEKMLASAFAVAEENASGEEVVLSPTCGSAGVFGGFVGYCLYKKYSEAKIIDSMMVAGLIGLLAKTNASISGAEAGCQAEIGVACAMAAAAIATIEGLNNDQIAQAAEIALEHSLGLTCDPVHGYVQIPCIERCAIYSLKAKDAVTLVKLLPPGGNKLKFDEALKTMLQTGNDLQTGYRETSEKGLAKLFK